MTKPNKTEIPVLDEESYDDCAEWTTEEVDEFMQGLDLENLE